MSSLRVLLIAVALQTVAGLKLQAGMRQLRVHAASSLALLPTAALAEYDCAVDKTCNVQQSTYVFQWDPTDYYYFAIAAVALGAVLKDYVGDLIEKAKAADAEAARRKD